MNLLWATYFRVCFKFVILLEYSLNMKNMVIDGLKENLKSQNTKMAFNYYASATTRVEGFAFRLLK